MSTDELESSSPHWDEHKLPPAPPDPTLLPWSRAVGPLVSVTLVPELLVGVNIGMRLFSQTVGLAMVMTLASGLICVVGVIAPLTFLTAIRRCAGLSVTDRAYAGWYRFCAALSAVHTLLVLAMIAISMTRVGR